MNASSLVVLVFLVIIVRQVRKAREIVASDSQLHLQSGQRFRTLLMQLLEPALALSVVGSVFVTHMRPGVTSVVASLTGAAVGVVFGVYRARSAWVAAVPAHRGVILRFSAESVLALSLLLVVKFIAEQDLLPRQGVFPDVVVGLLAFLLAESVARAGVVTRRYRQATATTVPVG